MGISSERRPPISPERRCGEPLPLRPRPPAPLRGQAALSARRGVAFWLLRLGLATALGALHGRRLLGEPDRRHPPPFTLHLWGTTDPRPVGSGRVPGGSKARGPAHGRTSPGWCSFTPPLAQGPPWGRPRGRPARACKRRSKPGALAGR